ncbi:M42 family metallopeptidase [Deinococcus yavapaiensis]|uniref:Endoglucanase n=1 Tax=Deinococcus yavapaiensis KR-236 TaxID=694435 RepID=A0A318S7H6_9DEIO|nr:M42 family metallopeptidase [Deinococcus yavapaiensis]PYE54866.1 endoglucanase [Deinococcus yavapaiensis KR-236]
MPTLLGHLQALVELTGPSGSEEDVVKYLAKEALDLADTVEVDAFGNVHAVKRAEREDARTLLIAAHTDEIGFRVKTIEPSGFLRLEKVGGSDDRILPAQRVWIRTREGKLLGVIGTKSAHLLTDADRVRVTPYTELYVDVGAESSEAVRAMGIRVGDPVGFQGELAELGRGTGRYTAHALDDRAGCAVLLALLERYRDTPPPVTLVVAFTTQEEVGLRGAQNVARRHRPDVALALDMTAVDDTPEVKTKHLRLGQGPAVKVMDMSTLSHPAVRRGLDLAADHLKLPVQHELLKGIGTDAGALQYAGAGTPAGAVSVGNRYTHSPVEVLDLADLQGALDLLHAFADALPSLDLRFVNLEE